MAFDQTDAGDGHTRGTGPGSRMGLLYFFAATMVSMLFGGIFMVLTAIAVKLAADSQAQGTKAAIVIGGAAIGAVAGGWMIQPSLSRHLARVAHSLGHKRD